MMTSQPRIEALQWAILAAMLGAAAWVWPTAPDRIPAALAILAIARLEALRRLALADLPREMVNT